jgi:hypothetical protein
MLTFDTPNVYNFHVECNEILNNIASFSLEFWHLTRQFVTTK